LPDSKKITLTDEQRDAVYAPLDRPVKVFAGAGTGKTTVLTHRYIHLIKDYQFPPEQVLALTFTRKAAAELRHRVKEALDDPKAASRAQIWNFDSFWWHLLRENPLQSGIEDDWRIVDETEVELFRDDIIRQTYRDSAFQKLFPLTGIQRIELSKILSDGYGLIPILKGRLVDGVSFRELMLELWEAGATRFSQEDNDRVQDAVAVLACLYRCYQDYLQQRHLLDFGDVLIRTFQMLRDHPELADSYRSIYRYVLIDETQDTNPAQFEIVKMLTKPGQINLTVVGDDKQSIYGFRGTSPEKFRKFDASLMRLKQNRRSPNEILDLATGLICKDLYWAQQRDEIALENPKRDPVLEPVIFLHCAESREMEARAVATRVRDLISQGASPESIALLFASKTHMAFFEQELSRFGIPFRSVGGSYYDRPEVKDGLALLKLMLEPNAVGPLSRMLERPPLSFGVRELQQALAEDELETPEEVQRVLDGLTGRLREVGLLSQRVSLPELLYQAMVHTGVLAAGCLDPVDGDRIRRNCTKLIRLAMEWDESVDDDPLRYFARLLEHRVVHGAVEEEELEDSVGVQLLTIHRAKGLEFDHVFWCDARKTKGGFLGNVNLDLQLDDIKDGRPVLSGLGLLVRPSPTMEEDSTRYVTHKEVSGDRDNEASRLHYVVVTRARETLTITCSGVRDRVPEPFKSAQELLSGLPFVQENWEISAPEDVSQADQKPASLSQETWVEKLQPLATRLQRRMGAILMPNDPLVLSFEDLERYRECPRLLLWRLVGRIAEEDTPEAPFEEASRNKRGMDFGQAAHRMLMDLPRYPRCEEHLDTYLAWQQLLDMPGAKARLERIVQNYRKLGFADAKDVRTEIPWTLPIKVSNGHQAFVRGVVDRIHRDDQGWVILDYKTGKIDQELHDRYFRQLNLYRLAAEAGLFPDVSSPRVLLVEIETGNMIDVLVSHNLNDEIADIVSAVYAGDFPSTSSTDYCAACPFRALIDDVPAPCDINSYEGIYHV
jgi:DNA helicase-2/ATP-dependent DNA helicase PcrA